MPADKILGPDDSISIVTAKLFGVIQRMPIEERRALLTELEARTDVENREHPRMEYFMVVHYAVGDCLSCGYIKNISSGGVFVETPADVLKEVSKGSQITLTFTHPNTRSNIKIQGKVVRIEDSGLGVSFESLIPIIGE